MNKEQLKHNFNLYKKNELEEVSEKKYILSCSFDGFAFGEILDDKPNGKWFIFNNDFTLHCIKNYNRGTLHGDIIYYYSDTQSIEYHYIYHRGEKIKYTEFRKISYIGGKGAKIGKRYSYHPQEYYENKFGRNYPIPKEVEQFVPEYYLKNDYYEKELYDEYMKSVQNLSSIKLGIVKSKYSSS